MSFTQFERIPMSDEYRRQFMEHELDEIIDALEDVDSDDRISVKALELQKTKIAEKLKKLLDSPKDNSLCFEKLGFDYLVCDEAHYYKNCFVSTNVHTIYRKFYFLCNAPDYSRALCLLVIGLSMSL